MPGGLRGIMKRMKAKELIGRDKFFIGQGMENGGYCCVQEIM